MTITRIINQYVDRAVGGFNSRYYAVDPGEVSDIQNHPMSVIHAERLKDLQCGFTAHGAYDTVPRCNSFLRQRVAKATAHPSDE